MALPIPTTGSYPQYYSGDTVKYTPQIYAKKLLIKFYDKTVFNEIANRDYEGEITGMGDKVIIRTHPDVVSAPYSRNLDLNSISQNLEPTAVELHIDKSRVYRISIDAIDEKQFDINALDEWATDGSEQMGIDIDTDVLANIYTQANSSNYGLTAGFKTSGYNMGTSGSPLTITKANVLDFITDAGSVLSEYAVPDDEERWMVLPTIIANRIQKSDLRSALFTGDSSNRTLRNGRIGMIDNFRIYKSNNLTAITGSVFPVIFGHKSALTFASQLVKNRRVELTHTFGTALDSLHVYGYKVANPKYMGYAAVQAG